MVRIGCLVSGLTLATLATGCGNPVKEEQIPVKASTDPLLPARSLLMRYTQGQPLGSEATTFPKLVEDLRAKDRRQADILQAGLDEIQRADPAVRPAKAQELLRKLESAQK